MKPIFSLSPRFGVKEQIKRQIRGLIESGGLKPGDSLPSSRDLALTLGVNRNSTWAAYRELTDEGWLTASVGSGTYVKSITTDRFMALGKLFDEMMTKAEDLGYDRNDVAECFLNRLACRPLRNRKHQILVVECNHETGEHIAECLKRELEADVHVMLIQDIEKSPDRTYRRLKEFDLIVCGFNHLEELKAAIPESPIETVGLLMQPDWQAIEILKTLPPGSAVGLTCANHRSTETLFKEIIYDNDSSLKKIWVGMDDPIGIQAMIKECRIVMASNYVYERVKSMASDETKVIMIELKPDQAGIAIVRRYLEGL